MHSTYVSCTLISLPIITCVSIDYIDFEYSIYDILDFNLDDDILPKIESNLEELTQLSIYSYPLLEIIDNEINTEELDEDNKSSSILLTSNIIPICSFSPQTKKIETNDRTTSPYPINEIKNESE